MVIANDGGLRDLDSLMVPSVGSLASTGDPFEPYRLLDRDGEVVAAVTAFLRDLRACGRPATTLRSYAMDLLRWYRFLWSVEIPWEQATRAEARDFSLWLQIADKPRRPHWRHRGELPVRPVPQPTAPNALTGKPAPGAKYAARTAAHAESVLRSFYDFHLEAGSGPMVNPFPLMRSPTTRRHRSPMEPPNRAQTGRYRPRVPLRLPRQIPDERFADLFAALSSHRDRALVSLWISTGARASELLGLTCGDVDPGEQLVTVVRKGTRALQRLPASPDAFVWLRLYQAEMHGLVPAGRDEPLWWTLRRPFRRLAYDAARAMFGRANAVLGANWTLHDLRHSAAYRMARDPEVALTDVQWILGHARLSTTQTYLNPLEDEVIASVLAYHARRAEGRSDPTPTSSAYRKESLDVLFGRASS
ncbi:MAG: tyrosine-type recombinase/integrase [Acidimicrobiales bacterium]